MARAGRKRKQGAERYPNGNVKQDNRQERPYNMSNVVQTGDRGKTFYRRKSALELLGVSEAERDAGEELAKLHRLCRIYYMDAPPMGPKVSNPNAGHGGGGSHDSDDHVNLGVEVHRRYQNAIRSIVDTAHDMGIPQNPILRAVLAVCVENKEATALEAKACRIALRALAQHFKF